MSAIQGVSEQKLNDLAFADDVALLEKSAERAQKQLYISQRSKVWTAAQHQKDRLFKAT